MGLETQQNSGKSAVELKIVSSSAYLPCIKSMEKYYDNAAPLL